MGTSLTGNNISASYLGLLKSTDSQAISTSPKRITDGNGNDLPLQISTSQVLFNVGTEAAPSISFNANSSEGFYLPTDETLAISLGGNERVRFGHNGSLKLNNYGGGSFTGTVTQRLGVTSSGDVVEIPIGAGALDGSGTAGKISKFTDSDTLGDSIISESSSTITIGASTPVLKFNNLAGGGLDPSLTATGTDFTISTTSRTPMTIDLSGGLIKIEESLGLGNIDPTSRLEISGGSLASGTVTNIGISSALTTGRTRTYDSSTLGSISTRGDSSAIEIAAGSSSGYVSGIGMTSRGATAVSGTIIGYTHGSERFRVDSSGNVGIATSSISQPLTVAGNVDVIKDAGNNTLFTRIHNQGTATNDDAVLTWQTQASRHFSMGIHRDSGLLTISNLDASVSSGELMTMDLNGVTSFTNNVGLADNKKLTFGAVPDFEILHNSNTNVNHVSSLIDRQLSINANIINLTNQANDVTYLLLNSTGGIFSGNLNVYGNATIGDNFADAHVINGATILRSNQASGLTLINKTNATAGTENVLDFRIDGNDNNEYVAGMIGSVAEGTWTGTSSTRNASLIFKSVLSGNNTERMRLNSSGNLGLGTSSPENKLHILTSDSDHTPQLLIQNSSTGDANLKFNISGDSYSVGIDNSDSDKFKISAGDLGTNDRLVIDSTGLVAVGTSTPVKQFTVDSGTVSDIAQFGNDNGSFVVGYTANLASVDLSATSQKFRIRQGSSVPLFIDDSARVGMGTTTPTQKLDVRGGTGAGTLTHAIFTGTDSRGLEIRTRSDVSGGQNSGCAEINSADSENDGGDIALSSNGNVRMFLAGSGALKLNTYGSGTHTGTTAKFLAVDSSGNVIESTGTSATIDGSGTAGKITKWSDSDTITDSIMSESGDQITLTAGTPSFKLSDSSSGGNTTHTLDGVNYTLSNLSTNGHIILSTNGTGGIGIGTSSPVAKLDVVDGTNNNEGADATDFRFVASNRALTTERANMELYTNDDQAVDMGASIGFGGRHTDSSTNDSLFATIKAGKENSTSANFAGYLSFGTSKSDSDIVERLRLDSSGNLSLQSATSLDFNVADFAQIKFKESGAIMIDSDNNQSSRNFQIKDGSGSSLLTVLDTGSTGIGTTSPNAQLHVVDDGGTSATAVARFRDTNATAKTTRLQLEDRNGSICDGLIDLVVPNSDATDSYLGIGHNDSKQLVLANGGNVGIGGVTTTPLKTLDVVLNTAGSRRLLVHYDDSLVSIHSANGSANAETLRIIGDNIRFNTGSSGTGGEAARIFSDGNVAIGQTSASEKLHVSGNIRINNADEIRTADTGGSTRTVLRANSSDELQYGWSANGPVMIMGGGSYTERLRVATNGKIGIGTTVPNGTGTRLQVVSENHSEIAAHFGQGQDNQNARYGGISLGYSENNTNYRKVGIIAEALGDGAARQNLHFLVDTANDDGSAVLADSKMMIDGLTGRVGIGKDNVTFHLEVESLDGNVALFEGTRDFGFKLVETSVDSGLSQMQIIGQNAASSYNALHLRSAVGTGVVIDTSNNVGFGTSTPSMKVNISHADQDGLRFNCADGLETFIDFGDASDNDIGRISYDHADNHMAFRTNNSKRLKIDSSGDVTIINDAARLLFEHSTGTDYEIKADGTIFQVRDTTENFPTTIQQLVDGSTGSSAAFLSTQFQLSAGAKTGWGAGDVHGHIQFHNYDGSGAGARNAASIKAICTQGNGSSSTTFDGALAFFTSDYNTAETETVRFTEDGNVLVGKTTNDDNTTGVRLNGTGILSASRAVNVAGIFNRTGNTGNTVLFRQGGTQVGSISVTSSATAYNTTGSDERLKKNISDWNENVLDKFKDLKPKVFNYNEEKDTDEKTKGFIAQNEIDKFPEAYPLVEDENTGEKRYWFNPSGMNVYLMKAIQELKQEIDELKKEI